MTSPAHDIVSGALVFTGERSRLGYRLNRMAMSLSQPANRAAFQADEAAYMRAMGLDDAEIDRVLRRDWKAMVDNGGSIYLLLKIAGSVGHTLQQVGAHTGGITPEALAERNKKA